MEVKSNDEFVYGWCKNWTFPILPNITIRKDSWYFNWLVFKFWNREAYDFEIALTMSTHWGIGLTALVPKLRIVCCVPCPKSIEFWVYKQRDKK